MTDPTRVVARRCVAFVIDGLVVVLVLWVSAQASGDFVDASGDCPARVPAGDACVEWNDQAYVIDGAAVWRFALTLVVLLVLVLGVTRWRMGASLGKALLGIRVVDARGHPAGIWRGAVRTAALVVDLIALLLPIGLWLALLTPGHRRVGDFLAGTFVVRKG
ncbi:MAG: RDD family protein [Acidimicrobiia bacterium]